LKEDEIAALDGDWSEFTPKERAAFAFARKFTFEPHRLTDADIAALRKHYNDRQILEMILSMAGNNAINRWKEGAGVPQNASGGGFSRGKSENAPKEPAVKHTYVTPTSETFKFRVTKVAPFEADAAPGQRTAPTLFKRPPLEPRAETERALEAARKRIPRLPLVEEAKAREVLGDEAPVGSLPEWVRLLATFPTQGKARIVSQRSAEEGKWDLTPLMKARAAWVIARQDRAWYAAGRAKTWLNRLGQTDDQVYLLDGDWSDLPPADRALLTVARKLAASPIVLTDADVAAALKLTGPREVVQLISYTTTCASFDRITEAAGLRLEP
jgi:alkylhydroperoxidase family enzyme